MHYSPINQYLIFLILYLDKRSMVSIALGILTSLYSLLIAFTTIDATFSGGNKSNRNGNLEVDFKKVMYIFFIC